MKKAQNLIEVSGILLLVVVVSLTIWPIFNKQKMKLVNMSKVETSGTGGNVITLPTEDPDPGQDNPSPPDVIPPPAGPTPPQDGGSVTPPAPPQVIGVSSH